MPDATPAWVLIVQDPEPAPTADDYLTPPLAPVPDRLNLPGDGRIETYQRRLAAGYAIFHPGDLDPRELSDRVFQGVCRLRNGAAAEGDYRLVIEDDDEDYREMIEEIKARWQSNERPRSA